MSLISTDTRTDALAYAKALTGNAGSSGAVAGGDFQSLLSSANDRANAIMGALNATVAEPSTAVNAQVIGQTDDTSDADSAKQEFLDFMAMDPQARMRAQMLGGMGLTEEQLAAMPADERKKIEDRIHEMIEAKVKEDTDKKVAESASAQIQAEAAPVVATAATQAATKTADAKPGDATSKEGITALDAMFPFLRPDTVTQTNKVDDQQAA